MKKRRFLLWAFLALLLTGVSIIVACNVAVDYAAKGRLYTSVDAIPYRKVGLLLGTTRDASGGKLNLYYAGRLYAAVQLYKAGKITYIIASGDNGEKQYNEPEMMRKDLMAAGVDSSHIFLDYAGFRTFDSIVRLREIFSEDSVTVISQQFHNERSIFIASHEGVDAIGFNAQDVEDARGWRVKVRETLARVKVFLDEITGAKPHFLGPRIPIPEA